MKKIALVKEFKGDRYEIKKIEECKALSLDTPCFSCELWKNGKKFAVVSNDGRGGLDTFSWVERPVFSSVEERYGLESSLGTLVYELLDLRETIAGLKRREKKELLLRKDGKYFSVPFKLGRKTLKIDEILESSGGKEFLAKEIKKYEGMGYEILNTNI